MNKVIGTSLLISGTCIGAAMLALPVKTAAAGFWPTIITFIFTCLIMSYTGLCLAEVSLWSKKETNLISMAKDTLGETGRNIMFITYISFLYSVMAAYTSGGTSILKEILFANTPIPTIAVMLIFVMPFMCIVYRGTSLVDNVNRGTMLCLIISYLVLISLTTQENTLSLDNKTTYKYILYGLPFIVTSFGFHHLIPSLVNYVNFNINKLRLAIIISGIMTCGIYISWEYITLSMIPIWGNNGFVNMLSTNANLTKLIIASLSNGNKLIATTISFFSISALISSFIGVSLGIFDFFADALQIKKNLKGKIKLLSLTFIPPMAFTVLYPTGFLLALGYAGIFAAILLIIFPALMVWFGRSKHYKNSKYSVYGGKPALIIVIIFGIIVVASEIMGQFNIIISPVL